MQSSSIAIIKPEYLVGRKYDTNTNTYYNIKQSDISTIDIYGNNVVLLTYEVTDGGELDMDGEVNGAIIDPVGLAIDPALASNNPNDSTTVDSELADTGTNTAILMIASFGTMTGALLTLRRLAKKHLI